MSGSWESKPDQGWEDAGMKELRRFFAYFRDYRGQFALSAVLLLATTGLTLVYPMILRSMLDQALPQHDWPRLRALMLLFLASFLGRGALSYASRVVLQKMGMRVTCDLRKDIFAHLQNLSLKYYEGRQTGQIVAGISEDTGALFSLVTSVLVGVVSDSVTLAAVIGMLFYLHWPLALMTLGVLPLFVLNYWLSKKLLRRLSFRHRRNWHRVLGFLHERVAGARLVKSFSMEDREIARFNRGIENDYHNFNLLTFFNTRLAVASDMISSFGLLAVLCVGGWLCTQGRLSIGTLLSFSTLIGFLFGPIVNLMNVNGNIDHAMAALQKIFETLDTPSFVVEAPGAPDLPVITGRVRVEGLHFSYDAGKSVLWDISFTAEPGQMVALVGPSGSGKSTLINLLCRFYDPDQGRILIDGHDIRGVSLRSLRRQIGVVMQDNHLFSGSVMDNLRYGDPSATPEAAIHAAKLANAHGFIQALPQGYHSLVGERGLKLSGGQRQRLAIARALLTDPRILIFDEATSALDSESEALVQDAMEHSIRSRSTFVIAHRLSTILRADQILVMEGGRVVEAGRHAALLHREGRYFDLFQAQVRGMAAAAN
jgi:subfamily B ATP-binding cassette protein MsbA